MTPVLAMVGPRAQDLQFSSLLEGQGSGTPPTPRQPKASRGHARTRL